MQNSQIPAKWFKPFAADDSAKVEIPITSADPTRASQSLGFPPLTMQPPESGGVPPQGEDFNGAMNQVARIVWWRALAGAALPFDGTWATNAAIGGYPQGALISSADYAGEWLSAADNNTNNPDTNGTNWVPGYHYGSTLIGTNGVNLATAVTLTPTQAAKSIIVIRGNLTAATTVTFPAWVKDWTIVNSTGTGNFTLTVKTAAGAGVEIPRGGAATPVWCDGTNFGLAAAAGRLLRVFALPPGVTAYTPTPGARMVDFTAVAGGGGGGGTQAAGASQGSFGGGGAGGNWFRLVLDVNTNTFPMTLTVGAGGAGGVGALPGAPGGATSIGALGTANGGGGGFAGGAANLTQTWAGAQGGAPGSPTAIGTLLVTGLGGPGEPGWYAPTTGLGGAGGLSVLGAGSNRRYSTGGNQGGDNASAFGGGGGGAITVASGGAQNGGDGGAGTIIIMEYA